jgi:hypothetical protein
MRSGEPDAVGEYRRSEMLNLYPLCEAPRYVVRGGENQWIRGVFDHSASFLST